MRYDSTAVKINRISTAPQNHAVIKRLPVSPKKPRHSTQLAKRIAVCAIILMMACFNIYTRAEINDTKSQLNRAQSQLEELESEETRLEMELQNLVSYANLEQEAVKLGMQKKTKSQIHYYDTSKQDRAVVIDSGALS